MCTALFGLSNKLEQPFDFIFTEQNIVKERTKNCTLFIDFNYFSIQYHSIVISFTSKQFYLNKGEILIPTILYCLKSHFTSPLIKPNQPNGILTIFPFTVRRV